MNVTMKTCICIAGMPASGKTTAALRLSEKLGIAMLSKDEIKEKLFDRIGFQSRQEKVQLGLAAMEILYYAAERCLAAGESVILENNFEDVSRPGLQALQERTGCRMITILFDGETRAVYERFVKRDQSPTRHRGHVVNDRYPEVGAPAKVKTLSFDAFEQSIAQRGYRRFSIGTLIPVDCTDPARIDVERLAQQIREQMDA